mmetsp:Transcript_17753/g.30063  ORF Transcript_17753/g.30063 Transcript_17753/m.30063 type:complete len:93 (-) Transcript_17753:853-1131(-)
MGRGMLGSIIVIVEEGHGLLGRQLLGWQILRGLPVIIVTVVSKGEFLWLGWGNRLICRLAYLGQRLCTSSHADLWERSLLFRGVALITAIIR